MERCHGFPRPCGGQSFWNASKFTFADLLADQHNIRRNEYAYVRGLSPNARDALERLGLPNQLDKRAEADILYMVVKHFVEIDPHPNVFSNLVMGYRFCEILWVTADLSNYEAGERLASREAIWMMVGGLGADDDRPHSRRRSSPSSTLRCGAGGMLIVDEDRLRVINE